MSKNVSTALKSVLANSYILYLKTQNYHWNVTGPQFKSYHQMFEEQYTDLAAAIDEIAERIRALGEKAPGRFTTYQELSQIKEGDENASAENMIKDLVESQSIIITNLTEALNAAQEVGDEVTAGILTDRLEIHEKNTWMLRSSI